MAREPKQRLKVYEFIKTYKEEHDGLSPTYEEIAQNFGWKNRMNAWFHVAGLERYGLIKLDADRRITVIGGEYIAPDS